jgi:hypothetical protein
MTATEAVFHYGTPPGEGEMRAMHEVQKVYGIRRILANSDAHFFRIEYDASRLAAEDIAALLRCAGIDLRDPLIALL